MIKYSWNIIIHADFVYRLLCLFYFDKQCICANLPQSYELEVFALSKINTINQWNIINNSCQMNQKQHL